MFFRKKPAPPINLNEWHKIQAAMLYSFASVDYIRGLHRLVTQLINDEVDPLLDLAEDQNRDVFFSDERWGARDTSKNWANNAWPFLKDLQISLAGDIVKRSMQQYEITDVSDKVRGISEYSMNWASPAEEASFDAAISQIYEYGSCIDYTLDVMFGSKWNDYRLTLSSLKFLKSNPRLPLFRIRTDIEGESGQAPSKAGVYISQTDSNAALQFAWPGDGKLRAASTFNKIGLNALETVGRADLWLNEQKMLDFAKSSKDAGKFREGLYVDGLAHADLAPSAVATKSFTDQACKWYFVEMIPNEYDEYETSPQPIRQASPAHRVASGQPCPEDGYYFTPAASDSRRHFSAGEQMPDLDATYGKTIWQWDVQQ